MNVKERLNLNIENDLKEKAKQLSKDVRLSISEIVELLISGTSESEILKLYNKRKGK
jgi:antitoxin component of RelBE/YafQ-DinJ toxin-antitoxin module